MNRNKKKEKKKEANKPARFFTHSESPSGTLSSKHQNIQHIPHSRTKMVIAQKTKHTETSLKLQLNKRSYFSSWKSNWCSLNHL